MAKFLYAAALSKPEPKATGELSKVAYYMRARYYNSDIKRFINQDIKTGGIEDSQSLNRYAYCEGNPVSLVDPFGLSPENANGTGNKWTIHDTLNVVGLFWDGADLINAALYAKEGNWVEAAKSAACALPFVGNVVAGVTKATKYAKAGKFIGEVVKAAGKIHTTAESAKTAIDLARDAKDTYAKEGKLTWNVATKAAGAIAMAGLSASSAKSLVRDVRNFAKATDISFSTSNQKKLDVPKNNEKVTIDNRIVLQLSQVYGAIQNPLKQRVLFFTTA